MESQQTKGEERCESYLPCNGVCLPRRIQSLLASKKSKTSKSKTDQHKKKKKKCNKKKGSGDGSFELSHTSGAMSKHTHTCVEDNTLTANNCFPDFFAIEIQLLNFICVSLPFCYFRYSLKSHVCTTEAA